MPARAHGLERVEPILEGAGGDDFCVVPRRGVQIVVVVVEPGRLELVRLLRRQHAEGRAGLHSEGLHLADHGQHLVEILASRRSIRRAHAEAGGAGLLGCARARGNVFDLEQLLRLQSRIETHALRAVSTILGTGTRLDAEQRADLHAVRRLKSPVHLECREHQFHEGQREQRLHFSQRPISAYGHKSSSLNGYHLQRRVGPRGHRVAAIRRVVAAAHRTHDGIFLALHRQRSQLLGAEVPQRRTVQESYGGEIRGIAAAAGARGRDDQQQRGGISVQTDIPTPCR